MNRLQLLLAASLAFGFVPGTARAQDYVYMATAGEMRGLLDQGRSERAIGYVFGVMDALMRSRDFCVPEGVKAGDIARRVLTLFEQQPRESNAPAADVIGVFLQADYPCRK